MFIRWISVGLVWAVFFQPWAVYAVQTDIPVVDQQRGALGSKKGVQCPIRIIPGKQFGVIKVGMSLDELKKLPLELKRVGATTDSYLSGPFGVTLYEGKVEIIDAELEYLPHCVVYGNKRFRMNATPEEAAMTLPKCQKSETMIGGNLIKCEGATISSGGWGGQQKTISLRVDSGKFQQAIEKGKLDEAAKEVDKNNNKFTETKDKSHK